MVWLYFRFPLSLRHVEDVLAEQGVEEFRSGLYLNGRRSSARGIMPASPSTPLPRGSFSDKWYIDEMVVAIKGKKHWLRRAVDADGYVLDALIPYE